MIFLYFCAFVLLTFIMFAGIFGVAHKGVILTLLVISASASGLILTILYAIEEVFGL